MPEEPVKLDETLDAKPYTPTKGRRSPMVVVACLAAGIMLIGATALVVGACHSHAGKAKFKCPDYRATYWDMDGRVVKTESGISDGYVLIPALGDAGSAGLGHYVRVEGGRVVEQYKVVPPVIRKNMRPLTPFEKSLAQSQNKEPRHSELVPSTEKAQLLKAQGGQAVWRVSQLHHETAEHRAQTFTHRFYLQRVNEQKAKLIYETTDTNVRYRVAIRDDGSVLLETRNQFHFISTAGPPVMQELDFLQCRNVYSDGLLAEDWSKRDPNQSSPIYFVPFDGKRLAVDDRVQLVGAGVKSFYAEGGLGYPGEPYRFENLFAWISDSTLHTFDLASRKRNAVKLNAQLHPSYRVTAFDGATVVTGIYVFDATTGQLLGETEYTKRPSNVASVFAVRNRIGYYYDKGTLMATDLATRDGRSIKLRDAEPIMPMQSREGLTVWDGKQWTLVRWLTDLRQVPEQRADVQSAPSK